MQHLISIIVATSNNNAIGKNNKLLWKLPNDMKFFKNTTWGHPIIMGRKTLESIGNKPLPGRVNIVLTKQAAILPIDVIKANNINQAVALAKAENTAEIFVIGGAEIYKQMLPICNRIYITKVDTEIEGDAFFDAIDAKQFEKIASQAHQKDDKHEFDYCFEVWQKISN